MAVVPIINQLPLPKQIRNTVGVFQRSPAVNGVKSDPLHWSRRALLIPLAKYAIFGDRPETTSIDVCYAFFKSVPYKGTGYNVDKIRKWVTRRRCVAQYPIVPKVLFKLTINRSKSTTIHQAQSWFLSLI